MSAIDDAWDEIVDPRYKWEIERYSAPCRKCSQTISYDTKICWHCGFDQTTDKQCPECKYGMQVIDVGREQCWFCSNCENREYF